MIQHCEQFFKPVKSHILTCENRYERLYRYQKLLTGKCPVCGHEVMAWIGIDYFGQDMEYTRINPTKHQHWIERVVTCQVSDYKSKGHNFVQGSVYDRRSGSYIFHPRIRVA